MVETKPVDKIFRDFEAVFGGKAILLPFHEEVVELEQQGYKIGRIANLFSLFFKNSQSDPEGAALLQKMQQIPMAEIIGSDNTQPNKIVVFLRNKQEEKASVSIASGEMSVSGEAWEKNPEFKYATGLLFSEGGPFPEIRFFLQI